MSFRTLCQCNIKLLSYSIFCLLVTNRFSQLGIPRYLILKKRTLEYYFGILFSAFFKYGCDTYSTPLMHKKVELLFNSMISSFLFHVVCHTSEKLGGMKNLHVFLGCPDWCYFLKVSLPIGLLLIYKALIF